MSKKINLFTIYLVIIHLFLIIVLVKSNFIPKVQERLYGNIKTHSEATRYYDKYHYNMMMRIHRWMDSTVQDGSVIFLGDSITQGLVVSNISANSVNFGIASDTTLGVLDRISTYKSLSHAKAIILAVGVNDLRYRNVESIINNYKTILNRLPSDVPIISSAVLPIDPKIQTHGGYKNISELNVKLQPLIENYKNIKFIDITDQLIDREHNLSTSYHTGDGIHLSAAGYKIWENELKNSLKNLVNIK